MDTNKPRCRPGLQTDQLSWKPRKLKSGFGDRGDGQVGKTRQGTHVELAFVAVFLNLVQ